MNLYQETTRRTGLIDLPDIDVLVNRYKAGERNFISIPKEKNEDLEASLSKENNLSLPTNTEVDDQKSTQSVNYNHEDKSNKTTNILDQSQNIKVDAVINHSQTDNDKDKQKSPLKITSDLERLIVELYLEEVADSLVKPSEKTLSPILKPNLAQLKNGQKKLLF